MIIEASKLKLRNVGQLAEFVDGGSTVMGTIERVKISRDAKVVTLRLSGESYPLPGDRLINIIRSSELHELYNVAMATEMLVEDTERHLKAVS